MADESQQIQRLIVSVEGRMNSYEKALNKALGVTDRNFGRMKKAGRDFEKQLGSVGRTLNSTLGLLGVGFSLKAAQNLIDAGTRITNSLKVAGLEGTALTRVYDALFESAQRNAAPVESLVELYGRASQVQKELGVSTSELLNFTDKIAVALRVSGKSAAESSGALLQLSQALGSGIVRAEEFNSILEGALPIAQAAAAGLDEAGGSVAKLRQLVVDGKVSSEAFFRAFEAGAVMLETKVASSELTASQGFARLNNTLIAAAGKFDDATGLSAGLAYVLAELANIVDDVGDAFKDNAKPLGDFFSLIGDGFASLEEWRADFHDWAGLTAPGGLNDFLEGTSLLKGRIGFRSQQPWDDPGEFPNFSDLDAFRGEEARPRRSTVSLDDFELPDTKARDAAAKAAEKQRKAVTDLIGDLEFEKSLIGESALEQEIQNALRRAGSEATDDQRAAIRTLTTEIHTQREAIEATARAMEEFGSIAKSTVSDFVGDLLEGKSATEALTNAMARLGQRLLDMALDQAISALLSSLTGAAFGGIAGGFSPQLGQGFTGPTVFGGGGGFFMGNFADGGAGRIPGSGPTDSVWAYARVTPGEPYAFGDAALKGIAHDGMSAGPQRVHVTVGLSTDGNGNIKPFVESISDERVSRFSKDELPGRVQKIQSNARL